MLLGFFPFGALAWIGYLIIGAKARNWKWLVLAAIFLGWIIGWFAWAGSWGPVAKYAPHPDPVGNAWWGWTGIAVWLGNAFVLQWIVNRRWLVWRANYRAKVWYQNATATRGAAKASSVAPSDATVTGIMNSTLAGMSGPPAAPEEHSMRVSSEPQEAFQTGSLGSASSVAVAPEDGSDLLDLNTATSDDLARLPGIDSAWADHIVSIRQHLGGFTDINELVTAASLQPHIFAAVRDRLEVRSPTDPMAPPQTPTSGRRLEF